AIDRHPGERLDENPDVAVVAPDQADIGPPPARELGRRDAGQIEAPHREVEPPGRNGVDVAEQDHLASGMYDDEIAAPENAVDQPVDRPDSGFQQFPALI